MRTCTICRSAPLARKKAWATGDQQDRRVETGSEIRCCPRDLGADTTGRGQRRRFGQQSKGSGGVHLRPLGAKFKFEALQFLNFGIRFYWVVVISGLSGQTSLENSRSKLEQLSNLVVHFHSDAFQKGRSSLSTLPLRSEWRSKWRLLFGF